MITLEDIQRLKLRKTRKTRRLKLRTFGSIPRHLLAVRVEEMADKENAMTMYEHSLESGYTLIELMFCICLLASVVLGGFIIYMGMHFIMKFW